MKEVFISYSTIDTANAETIRNVLEKNGLSCWMAPRDIPGGSNYTKEIPIAIRNCKVFLLILSKNAQSSQWVLKELDSAVNAGKAILPFMLEDCALNDEFNFLLTGAQRYSAYQKTAETMEALILRIRGIIETSGPCYEEAADTPAYTPAEESTHNAPTSTPHMQLSEAECPACGFHEVTPLPKRLKRNGLFELSTMLLIIAMAFVLSLVALVFSAFLPSTLFDLVVLLYFIGAIAGGILGNQISKTIVKRRRIRQHLPNKCYRCNACKKVFLTK